MHNMSNQFYNYVTEELVSLFKRQDEINKVGRYYLQLPTTEISDIIYDLLNKQEATQSFIYKHDQGNEAFKTIALHFGDQHFVIAKVTENITPSFLVTLRNAMSLQQAEWKNASLVLLTA